MIEQFQRGREKESFIRVRKVPVIFSWVDFACRSLAPKKQKQRMVTGEEFNPNPE